MYVDSKHNSQLKPGLMIYSYTVLPLPPLMDFQVVTSIPPTNTYLALSPGLFPAFQCYNYAEKWEGVVREIMWSTSKVLEHGRVKLQDFLTQNRSIEKKANEGTFAVV